MMLNIKNIFATSLLIMLFVLNSCKKEDISSGIPISKFTSDFSVGEDSLTVHFSNISAEATTFIWNFGDDSAPVYERNAEHQFVNSSSTTKKYTVSLIAQNPNGNSDTVTQQIIVCKKPIASFTVVSDFGATPFLVKFTNTSTNSATYSWNFGDSFTATGISNPQHTFINNTNEPKVYTVILSVKNEFGTSASFSKNVTVNLSGIDSHIAMGNPGNAQYNIDFPNNYLMSISQYIISYNNSKRTANWVSWHLSPEWIGDVDRQDDFRANLDLPSAWYHVDENDYSGSGFDRGHLCPSADRTNTIVDNSSTFLMTNMMPQSPNNNQVTWANLESYCRSLVSDGKELYIIAGPYGQGGTGSNGYKTTVGNEVVVPSDTWKVIMVLPAGANDLTRVSTSTRVIAVKMPNNMTCSSQPWTHYRTSVDAIETLTGFDFFSNVSADIQAVIETRVDNVPAK